MLNCIGRHGVSSTLFPRCLATFPSQSCIPMLLASSCLDIEPSCSGDPSPHEQAPPYAVLLQPQCAALVSAPCIGNFASPRLRHGLPACACPSWFGPLAPSFPCGHVSSTTLAASQSESCALLCTEPPQSEVFLLREARRSKVRPGARLLLANGAASPLYCALPFTELRSMPCGPLHLLHGCDWPTFHHTAFRTDGHHAVA
jgi:hypothetical protein